MFFKANSQLSAVTNIPQEIKYWIDPYEFINIYEVKSENALSLPPYPIVNPTPQFKN